MFGWLREWYEIRRENQMPKLCESCEVLKVELANERREKQMLLQHVLSPASNEPTVQTTDDKRVPTPIMPRHTPWKVVQAKLEADDRKEAERIMREFREKTGMKMQPITAVPIPDKNRSEEVAKMEKEMVISDAG